jgi:sporulation protein YlmC with PRC-barrel domain
MLQRVLISPVIATMLFASAAASQTAAWSSSLSPAPPTQTPTVFTEREGMDQLRVSKLEGLDVYNHSNQRLGEIRELLVDRNGQVDAVVIGVGGFLGLREHEVAVPFQEITWVGKPHHVAEQAMQRPYPQHAVLNVTKDQLLTAPGFEDVP